jgi:hypothetical protein
MNTPDSALTDHDAFSVAELEARFEMQAIPVGLSSVTPDWKCNCSFES